MFSDAKAQSAHETTYQQRTQALPRISFTALIRIRNCKFSATTLFMCTCNFYSLSLSLTWSLSQSHINTSITFPTPTKQKVANNKKKKKKKKTKLNR